MLPLLPLLQSLLIAPLIEGGFEFSRRCDVVTHIVVNRLQHDQRSFRRGNAEFLPDTPDFCALHVVIGLQCVQSVAGPEMRGQWMSRRIHRNRNLNRLQLAIDR